jgi:hypothetical protein
MPRNVTAPLHQCSLMAPAGHSLATIWRDLFMATDTLRDRHEMVPVLTENRSASPGPSFAPAASPRPPPQAFTVASPLAHLPDTESATRPPDDRALHPGPYPPDLSRCHAYGALPLVPARMPSGSLADPAIWQVLARPGFVHCFPPSPAPPGSGCAQLQPGCCDSPARRPPVTSFDSQRLTAHQRLVAHSGCASFSALLRQGQRRKVSHLHSNRQRLTAHVDRG